ncbi:hypothetical protein SK854_44215 [Lentzea sp. BCCO 10_0061]|uniref:Uncharacterized protein n=1 Tax=Lentzea sokolovensis TaxID=3095429 RepID=A0ABU4VCT8_9PSEU|nr:hypothetical protein [Lentzea sp. BCCO 10_0061]MDX8149192.1 hypothetical protein [Lentzea sp. BCCO 10_0061]
MIGWSRHYFADEDASFHYEVDDEGRVCRQVDLRGTDLRPLTAVIAYEKRFGVLAEGAASEEEVRACPGVEEISAGEFERVWTTAREHLERVA